MTVSFACLVVVIIIAAWIYGVEIVHRINTREDD